MILQKMQQEQFEVGYAKGIAKSRLEDIFDLLEDLPGEVSEKLQRFLSAEDDCGALRKYHRLAVSTSSVDEFTRQLPKSENFLLQ